MNRLVAIPLILVLLMGACFPRAHGSLGAAQSEGFAGHPHVHLSGEHDHHHGESRRSHSPHQRELGESSKDSPAALTTFRRSNHHHDAVYLADFSYTGRDEDAQKTVDVSEFAVLRMAGNAFSVDAHSWSHRTRVGEGAPSLFGALPIYLSHAVLRL